MKETLVIANNPIMWILALIIIANVVVQCFIFFFFSNKQVKETAIISSKQVKEAFKIGFIGTIGPASVVFAVAVALIA